jgi:hypothetical protein
VVRAPAVGACAETLETRRLFTGGIFIIKDASVVEGDSGNVNLTFEIDRLGLPGADSVLVATSDGTASAAEGDYTAQPVPTPIIFFEGETFKYFRVVVHGDNRDEQNETVIVTLSSPSPGAAIADPTGVGTIIEDDDHPPSVQIAPISPDPRETPLASATFTWSEDMYSFRKEDIVLTRDRVPVPFTAAQTLTTQDNMTFVLNGLAALTSAPGEYAISVPPASLGNIFDDWFNSPLAGDIKGWTMVPAFAPDGVSVTHLADCVTVNFHDNSNVETGFEVQRSTSPAAAGFTTVGTLPANATSFDDPGPLKTDGTAYWYRVRAIGPGNNPSFFVGAPGPVVPTPPGGAVNYTTFEGHGAEMTFNGSAALVSRDRDRIPERLMLTDDLDSQAGSAYLTEPRRVNGFKAAFDFQVTRSTGADGFTFVLQAAPDGTAALGAPGGGMGYTGMPNSVAVKYDFWPPGTNQTGVYVNGEPFSDDGGDPHNRDVPADYDFDNDQIYHTTLSYDPTVKVLTQTIDDIDNSATAPFIATYNVDIEGVIGQHCAYVGFTGGTGLAHARQEIISFSYDHVTAPTVQQVYVGGTTWTAAFKNYLEGQTIGSGQFGYAVGDGARQLAVLPWGGVNQISVKFSRDVLADVSDLAVRGVNVATYPVTTFAYNDLTHTATWTLGRSIANDKVMLDLDADGRSRGVRGSEPGGQLLDGEWAVGGTYPSGDVTPGGDFRFRLDVLGGDATRDGRVNALDMADAKRRNGRAAGDGVTGTAAYSAFADFDGGGRVNALDLAFVKGRLGQALPSTEPTATAALSAGEAQRRESATRELFGSAPIA